MGQLDAVTNKRHSYFEDIYSSLKVNRFISKSWSTKLSVSTEEINDMVRQVYFDEAQ